MNNSKQRQASSNLIAMARITDDESGTESLLALDSCGIVNQWFINEDLYDYINDKEIDDIEQIDHGDMKHRMIPPCKAYCVNGIDGETSVSSMKAFGGVVYFTGEFETFGVSGRKFKQKYSRPNNKVCIETIDKDLIIKDKQHNREVINGIDCNGNIGALVTYSNEGNVRVFDIERQTYLSSYNHGNNHSIYSGKMLDNRQIAYGGSDGKIYFLSNEFMNYIGAFDVFSNTYYPNDSNQNYALMNHNRKCSYEISSIEITPNYLLASCNNFIMKYNLSLNLCTNVIKTRFYINSFTKTDTSLLVASNDRNILKFPNDKNTPITIPTSSSSLSSIVLSSGLHDQSKSIGGNRILFAGGDSNIIDMINNEIICSFIF